MIRRAPFVLLGILIMVSPLGLAAQSADSRQNIETISAESSAGGGCYAAGVADEQSGHGFDLANLDRSVSPCDDFFQFADGGWVKSHAIPAAYPSWGTFNKLREDNENVLRGILDKAAADKNAVPGSNWQKIGDFYASCMDTVTRDRLGLAFVFVDNFFPARKFVAPAFARIPRSGCLRRPIRSALATRPASITARSRSTRARWTAGRS